GMIAQRSGKIVNIASDAGRVGEVRQAVYSGAKAAVIAFSKAVAKEVGRYNIHVNCVCPGLTSTPATAERLTPELQARIVRLYPLGRLGLPEDVAKAVTFLASDGASHITGQTLSVSGGYTMVWQRGRSAWRYGLDVLRPAPRTACLVPSPSTASPQRC